MGYFSVPDWFVDSALEHLTLPELRVLLFLLRVADKDGMSFWSIKKIAGKLGSSETQVKTGLKRLEANLWIERVFRKGHSTVYHVHHRFITDKKGGRKADPPQAGSRPTTPSGSRPYKDYTGKGD